MAILDDGLDPTLFAPLPAAPAVTPAKAARTAPQDDIDPTLFAPLPAPGQAPAAAPVQPGAEPTAPMAPLTEPKPTTPQAEPGWLTRTYRGLERGQQSAYRGNLLAGYATGALDQDTFLDNVAKSFQDEKQFAPSASEQARSKALKETTEKEGYLAGAAKALSAPGDLAALVGESLPAMAQAGIGTVVGGLTAGPVGAAAGTALGSAYANGMTKFFEVMQDNGVDVTNKEALKTALNNPELMVKVRNEALNYGVAVGVVDALSAGIAGKIAPIATKALGKGVAGRVGGAAGEAGMQAGLGAGSEVAGQVAQKGEVYDPTGVLLEAAAELPGGAVETAVAGLRKGEAAPAPAPPTETPPGAGTTIPEGSPAAGGGPAGPSPTPPEPFSNLYAEAQGAAPLAPPVAPLPAEGGAPPVAPGPAVPDEAVAILRNAGLDDEAILDAAVNPAGLQRLVEEARAAGIGPEGAPVGPLQRPGAPSTPTPVAPASSPAVAPTAGVPGALEAQNMPSGGNVPAPVAGNVSPVTGLPPELATAGVSTPANVNAPPAIPGAPSPIPGMLPPELATAGVSTPANEPGGGGANLNVPGLGRPPPPPIPPTIPPVPPIPPSVAGMAPGMAPPANVNVPGMPPTAPGPVPTPPPTAPVQVTPPLSPISRATGPAALAVQTRLQELGVDLDALEAVGPIMAKAADYHDQGMPIDQAILQAIEDHTDVTAVPPAPVAAPAPAGRPKAAEAPRPEGARPGAAAVPAEPAQAGPSPGQAAEGAGQAKPAEAPPAERPGGEAGPVEPAGKKPRPRGKRKPAVAQPGPPAAEAEGAAAPEGQVEEAVREERTAYRTRTNPVYSEVSTKRPGEKGRAYGDVRPIRVDHAFARMWDAKGVRKSDTDTPGPVPKWLDRAQRMADFLADRFDLPPIKVWVGVQKPGREGTRGLHFEWGSFEPDTVVEIALDHTYSQAAAISTLLHEIGHAVMHAKIRAAGAKLNQQIAKAHQAWRANILANRGKLTWRDIRPTGMIDLRADAIDPDTKLSDLTGATLDYALNLDEYVADQVRHWLQTDQRPTTAIDKFFQGLARMWQDLFRMATGHRGTDKVVTDFLSGLWDGAQISDEALAKMELQGADVVQEERISSRFPATKRAKENPLGHDLTINIEAMRHSPEAWDHNVGLTLKYPGVKIDARLDTDARAAKFIDHCVRNLLWLHDNAPATIRERGKRWYNGANAIANHWARQFDQQPHNIAGVLAALSPQKDWFQNVSLAERVLDIHNKFKNPANDMVPTPEMLKTGRRIFAKEKFVPLNPLWMHSPYSQLTGEPKAMWLRAYDETYNPRTYRVVSPEGDFVGAPGKKKVAWGSNNEIGKAIRSLDAPLEKVSALMGMQNKVRSFFNNILDPDDLQDHGDVTIDTHAVAAALLRPLSGNTPEVFHNFGNALTKEMRAKFGENIQNAKSVDDTGAAGLYGLYAEAYKRAAAMRGLLPREMQSITWEAVRELYTAEFKRNALAPAKINAIWTRHTKGYLTRDQALQIINRIAGGMNDPAWSRSDSPHASAARASSYEGELAQARIRRGAPGGVRPATGGGRLRPSQGFARVQVAATPEGFAAEEEALNPSLREGADRERSSPEGWKQDLAGELPKPGWAILTATQEDVGPWHHPDNVRANDKLRRELATYRVREVSGRYNGVDQGPNFLIFTNEHTAREIGRRYNQESVLTSRGLVWATGDRVIPAVHGDSIVGSAAEQEAFHSIFEGQAFSMGLDNTAADTVQEESEPVRQPTVREFTSKQQGRSYAEMHERATVLQRQLGRDLKDIAEVTGASYANPGVKEYGPGFAKITRKRYMSAGDLTDLARAGFIVNTPGVAEGVVDELRKRYEILDEDWNVNDTGYFDRKVLIRAADGTIGEIQVTPRPMKEAKYEGGMGKVYQTERDLPPGPEKTRLIALMTKTYTEAALSDSRWATIWRGKAKSQPGNLSSQSERESSEPVSRMSETSTSVTQSPSSESLAAARMRSSDTTAGRQSQLKNLIDETPDVASEERDYEIYQGGPHAYAPEVEVEDLRTGERSWLPMEEALPDDIVRRLKSGDIVVREHPLGRLRLDKIGTGEKEKVFGWGLYLAEAKSVAAYYRETLTRKGQTHVKLGGEEIFDRDDFIDAFVDDATGGKLDAAGIDSGVRELIGDMFDDMKENGSTVNMAIQASKALNQPTMRQWNRFVEYLGKVKIGRTAAINKGHIHAFKWRNINPALDLLQWDERLEDQPPKVKAAITPIVQQLADKMDAYRRELADRGYRSRLGKRTPLTPEEIADLRKPSDVWDAWTGENLYDRLQAFLGAKVKGDKDKEASLMLAQAGVPGHRYADQMSRNAPEGKTYNFVLFEEALADVVAREEREPSVQQMNQQAQRNAAAMAAAGVFPSFEKPADPNFEEVGKAGYTHALLTSNGRADLRRIFGGNLKSSFWHVLRRGVQDSMLDMRAVQRAIVAAGGKVGLLSDVYQLSSLYFGKVASRIEGLIGGRIAPLLKEMGADGITQERMDKILQAQHAEERNRAIRAIDPSNTAGSGLTDQEAQAIKATVTPQEQAYADRIRAIIRDTNQKAWDAGLLTVENAVQFGLLSKQQAVAQGILTQQEVNQIPDPYQNYVPLKGFEGEEAEGNSLGGSGFNVQGSEFRKAFGRHSKADGPMAYIFNDALRSIMRQEKNAVGIALYRLVINNPNPELWAIDRPTKQISINPKTGMVQVRYGHQAFDAQKSNVLTVKIGGKERHIEIFHSGLADAMKSLTAQDQTMALRLIGNVTRYLSAINTSLNPEWFLANVVRDVETAMAQMQTAGELGVSKQALKGLRREIMWNWNAARKGAIKGLRHSGAGTQWQKTFEDFDAHGGRVNWIDYRDVQKFKGDIDSMLKEGSQNKSPWYRARLLASATMNNLSTFNTAAENAIRVSTYAALVKRGVPKQLAASAARELTVNFNRKGKFGPTVNAMYMFFNASIQGNVALLSRLSKSRYAQAAASGYLILGVIEPLLAEMFDPDDDDWYDRIPDYIRNRNIIIPTGAGGKDPYLKIPIPYGLNLFKATGQAFADYGRGRKNALEAAIDVVTTTIDVANPLGSSSSIVNMLAPTILDPLISLYANTNEMSGRLIAPGDPYSRKPDSEQYFKSASDTAVNLAATLNILGGGSQYEEGGFMSMSPNTLDYVGGYVGGGLWRFTSKFIDTAGNVSGLMDGELDLSRAPIVSSFYGYAGDERALAGEYYEIQKTALNAEWGIRAAQKAGDKAEVQRMRARYGKEMRILPRVKSVDAQLKKLKEQQTNIDNNPAFSREERFRRTELITKQREKLEAAFLKQWRDINGQL